ncbi:WYL domain-containing protein [Paenibacillus sp. YN15]|uniref:WYL domain-containing protein n=1 Tax=Paenibacillus sp. YN15 TaxID=1742774 RepID=UPI000DCD85BD|nr:WYL domain-containing protein [Paenibacillus sp. YN15]RAU98874.1 WYL domain-containing protein [Paenibacillus sp. YN15]
MNLFEKIFNYQIISRLEDSGAFMVTAHERAWLKTMLGHPAAREAFTPETLEKLRSILEPDETLDTHRYLLEKARSVEKQVYHPLLRTVRRLIQGKSGICLSYKVKDGRVHTGQHGCPYKLEYSMVKREWYLLWFHLRSHSFMSTRLQNILSLEAEPLHPQTAGAVGRKIGKLLDFRRSEALIEIIPMYNEELSRILYAFSSFEKDVLYDGDTDTYRVKVTVMGDQAEYLLSKIRFLGKRVRVVEGNYLKRRMLEASAKALDRYGVGESGEALSPSS